MDGSNDQVRINNYSIFNGMRAFTVSAWVYPTQFNSHNSIVSKVTPSRDFVLKLTGTGRINVHFYDQGYRHCTSDGAVPLNQWSHIAAIWTGSEWRLFLNGNLVKITDHSGYSPPWTGTRMGIGTMNWSEVFTGRIDEVRVAELGRPEISRVDGVMQRFKDIPQKVRESTLYGSTDKYLGAWDSNLIPGSDYEDADYTRQDDHFQGIQRIGQYLIFSGGVYDGFRRSEFYVVEMGSQSKKGPWALPDYHGNYDRTYPHPNDRIVHQEIINTNSNQWHSGGIQAMDYILAVPVNNLGVNFYDMTYPKSPSLLDVSISRTGKSSLAVALTRLPDNHYLALVWDDRFLDFYYSISDHFFDGFPSDPQHHIPANSSIIQNPYEGFTVASNAIHLDLMVWSKTWEWNNPTYQSLNFIQDADNRIYFIGTRNESNLAPVEGDDDQADLYEITWPTVGSTVDYSAQPVSITGIMRKQFYCYDDQCNFNAAAGVYVEDSTRISIYSGFHYLRDGAYYLPGGSVYRDGRYYPPGTYQDTYNFNEYSYAESILHRGGDEWGGNNYTTAIAFGDIDGDGRDEVGIARKTDVNARYYILDDAQQNFNLLFEGGNNWGSSNYATSIAFGDIDNDGRDEIGIARYTRSNARYFILDDKLANFTQLTEGGNNWGSSNYATSIAFGDVDGDGYDEVGVTRKANSNERYVILNDISSNFNLLHAGGHGWGSSNYATSIAFGNVDNDNQEEVGIARYATSNGRYFILDDRWASFNQLNEGGNYWGSGNYATAIAFGNVDGDSRDEIGIARRTDVNARYYIIDDSVSNFNQLHEGGNGWGSDYYAKSIAFGDADGDGRDEIGVARYSRSNARYFIFDDGMKGFKQVQEGGHHWGEGNYSTSIEFGDTTGDNKAEVGIGRKSDVNSRYYILNDGDFFLGN